VITQLNGRHLAGNAPDMLISGISRAYNNHFNPDQIAQDLNSGKYYLVSFGNCHAPLLRKVARVNDAQQDHKASAEWEIITNTHSEALTSDLKFLMQNVPKPAFVSATIRQEAKPDNTANASDGQQAKKEMYWVELVCEYKDPDINAVEDMGSLPYKVTFADGTTKQGYLSGGYKKLSNIPAGDVEVVFGYPEAEDQLKEVRREIQVQLNGIISDAAERAKLLDEELAKNSITMQSVILTGAFLDGMFGPIEDFGDFCAELVEEAQVRFEQWDAFKGIDDYEDLKDAVIEKVGKAKKRYLSYVAEVDDVRIAVQEAIFNGNVEQINEKLEELATFANNQLDNIEAYGAKTFSALNGSYQRLSLLFEDEELKDMLIQFAKDYVEVMPNVERVNAGGGVATGLLLAVVSLPTTGGAGAVAVLGATKADKIKDLAVNIKKVEELIEQKMVTPPAALKGPAKTEIKGQGDKHKETEVKKEEKKICGYQFKGTAQKCKKDYNKNCPLCHKGARQKGKNKGNSTTLSNRIMTQVALTEKAKNPSYAIPKYKEKVKTKNHPWYVKKGSLQAHHIICSETVDSDRWKDYFDMCGYDINCKENGVMLPNLPSLACQLAVPLHRSNHNDGEAEIDGKSLSYVRAVKRLLLEIEKQIRKNKFCSSPNKIKTKLEDTSHRILGYLAKFEWTLTYDGRDYDDISTAKGCSGLESISKYVEKEERCESRSHGYAVDKTRSLRIGL